MKFPVLKSSPHFETTPILIVDKIGAFGERLAEEFSKDYLVVFVSSQSPVSSSRNIVHVQFKRKIPQIPDNKYLKIFIVDDGESVTRKSSFSFISKAREDEAPLYFIASARNVDVSHAGEIMSSYTKAKVLIFGDLFDNKIFFDKDLAISRYILSARSEGKIEVEGNGLSLSFPMAFSDTIKLIVKASHLNISQKTILLFYPHPITDISLSHLFQKINPNISVDFTKEKKEKKIYIPLGAVHALSKYDLLEKVKELNLENNGEREVKIVENKEKRISIFKPFFLIFIIAVFFTGLPVVTAFFYYFLGVSEMSSSQIVASKGEFENALKKARNSNTFFETASKLGQAVVLEARIIGRQNDAQKLITKIDSAKLISSATIYFFEGGSLINEIYYGKSKDPKSDFLKASGSFKSGITLIQKVRAAGLLPATLDEKIESLDPVISLFSNSSEILADLLGFEKEKKYLVLFQDNTSLRPGGGLIRSVAILKIKNGKITELEVSDVSKIDSKLKTHVEPPFAIRRYLPSENLYLKDSNFDPDFVQSAILASNIYSLSTREKVDGVIGLDLFFTQNIISALGQVNIPSYRKKVSAGDVFKLVQKEPEKDFLGSFALSLVQDLKGRKNIPYIPLAQKIGKSVKEKHLIFAFAEKDAQNIFSASGWSSVLWDTRREEKGKINDYLGISEASLGGSGLNNFISRSVAKKLLIYDDGRISSKLTIAFKNGSKKEEKEGNYKNYLQLILPQGSKITTILTDNKKVEVNDAVLDFLVYEQRGFKPPKGIEVEGRKEMGKSIFGFLISVGPNSLKTVTISYELPYSLGANAKSVDYSLKVYKQPGIESYPFDLTFSIPFTYQILEGKESYSWEIRKDEEFSFKIVQK